MRILPKLACITLLTVLCHAANQQAPESPRPATFPVIVSYSLDKAKVTLPRDLEGQINLLLLSFEREQQRDADSWMPIVKQVQASRADFRHYFLPVFTRENFLYRWWLNSSLRSDLPEGESRRSTIPLYVNRQIFLRELQISSDREISVLLVAKNGRVIWRTTGPLTEEKRAALQSAIVSSGRTEH